MARIRNTNYRAEASSDFEYATDPSDRFFRDDVNEVGEALDRHDHTDGRGLPVGRTGANSVVETSIANDAVNPATKIPEITIDQTQVPGDNTDRLTLLLGQIANRIKTGFGVTNWYDTPPASLATKVSKSGDQMVNDVTGRATLVNFSDTRNGVAIGGVDDTMWSRASFIASVSSTYDVTDDTHPGAYPAFGFHRQGISAYALYHFVVGNGRLWIRSNNVSESPSQILTTLDEGAGHGLDADTLRTLIPGHASGNIPYSTPGTMNAELRAEFAYKAVDVGGVPRTFDNNSGGIPVSNGAINVNLVAAKVADAGAGVYRAGNDAGNVLPINNSALNSGLFASAAATTQNPSPGAGEPGFVSVGHGSMNIPINNGVLNVGLNAEKVNGLTSGQLGHQYNAGTYTGGAQANGSTIAVGFAPVMVIVWDASDPGKAWLLMGSAAVLIGTGAGGTTPDLALAGTGFTIGATTNVGGSPGHSYKWTAFGA